MRMFSAFRIGAMAAAASLAGITTNSQSSSRGTHDAVARADFLIEAGDPVDEGLMHSEYGPTIFMNTHSSRTDNSGWLEFGMGACGVLERVDTRNTLIQRTGLSDDFDDEDDDPSADGRALLGLWLSDHAEVAVINDAVDRACDDYWFGNEDFETDQIA